MNDHLKKNILNILLGIIPVSKVRKNLRTKLLFAGSRCKISANDKLINQVNNNKFLIVGKDGTISNCLLKGLKVKFIGKNSTLIVHEPVIFEGCSVTIGNNSTVEIFSTPYKILRMRISATNSSTVVIGENFSCRGCIIENHDEPNLKVVIGKNCLFSYGINLRVSDGHTLYQLNNNEIINKPKEGIIIGDHVWIGMKATVLKDVTIPPNSIVGADSLVNKSFDRENIIIAGTPAKIVKENINWAHENTSNFAEQIVSC